eukprot:362326-Chlamydomonas_euryale.AAC.2
MPASPLPFTPCMAPGLPGLAHAGDSAATWPRRELASSWPAAAAARGDTPARKAARAERNAMAAAAEVSRRAPLVAHPASARPAALNSGDGGSGDANHDASCPSSAAAAAAVVTAQSWVMTPRLPSLPSLPAIARGRFRTWEVCATGRLKARPHKNQLISRTP